MGLKSTTALAEPQLRVMHEGEPKDSVKSYSDVKDAKILYQGLTQAALQSMPLGQFAPDLDTHIANVKRVVEDLAAFVLAKAS